MRKATTCDLCQSLGPNHEPSCVYACPHDAAHRMKGHELFDLVRAVHSDNRTARRMRCPSMTASAALRREGRGEGFPMRQFAAGSSILRVQ